VLGLCALERLDPLEQVRQRRGVLDPVFRDATARPPESRQEGDKVVITPRRLNVVVLGAPDRFKTAAQLLAHGWELYDAWAARGRPIKADAGAR